LIFFSGVKNHRKCLNRRVVRPAGLEPATF
jgi:hypothetical protein